MGCGKKSEGKNEVFRLNTIIIKEGRVIIPEAKMLLYGKKIERNDEMKKKKKLSSFVKF